MTDGYGGSMGLLLLRAMTGLIVFYNSAKTLGIFDRRSAADGVAEYSKRLVEAGLPSADILAWVVIVIMFVGGIGLVLGAATRAVGVAVAAVAIVHIIGGAPSVAPATLLEGHVPVAAELNALVGACAVALVLLGGGDASVDAMLARRERATA